MAFGNSRRQVSQAVLPALGDEQLMRELQAGNPDAFAVLFRRYRHLVYAIALRILGNAGEAEDMTQDVFFEVFQRAAQFDPARGTVRIWLVQYAYSRSRNRRNYLLVRQVHNRGSLDRADEAAGIWSPAKLAQQEVMRLTSEGLAMLSEDQRRTIEMFFFEGLTLKEIAEHRKEKFSNVRHHYYRALSRLRSCVTGDARRKSGTMSMTTFGGAERVET